MKSPHLLEIVSRKGENGTVCSKSGLKKESNDGCPNSNNMLSLGGTYALTLEYLSTMRKRSNVYIFAFATLVSLVLGSHGHVDPIIARSVGYRRAILWPLQLIFIMMQQILK